MLYSLKGKISEIGEDYFILEKNGFGFRFLTTAKNIKQLKKLKSTVKIFCFLYFRQDHFELYGFLKEEEIKLFELLNSISGIGPKTALSILEIDQVEKIMAAIIERKIDFLARASGLSRKGAERLVVELQNKIKLKISPDLARTFDLDAQVEEALISLGYSRFQAQEVLINLDPKIKTLEERLRQALKLLSRS